MEYATILFNGRRLVGGKYEGSEQWPEGGLVMLAKFNIELTAALNRI